MSIQHVCPVNDLRPHETNGGSCECNPKMETLPNGDFLFIHNSYDGREIIEQIERGDGYADPSPDDLADPLFEAIWQRIKAWDVNVPTRYSGYMGATGNHVMAILSAVRDQINRGKGHP